MSDDLRFDVRVLAHRKRRGELTDEEINKYLGGLADDAEHGEETETVFTASFAQRAANEADANADE